MTFKSPKQPLCRACGKKIPKRTDMIYVYATPPRSEIPEMTNGEGEDRFKQIPTGKMIPIYVAQHIVGAPTTKDEAQRLVNQKIVSVQRSLDSSVITRITVWDGETYEDEFFCTRTTCAVNYAYMCVQSSNNKCVSVAYADAHHQQTYGRPRK